MCTYTATFVAKDMGSHSVVNPIIDQFEREGHNIIVAAEGIAAEYFQADGRKLAFAGTRDFRDVPFSLNCEAFLATHSPHVLTVGEGSPNNLEGEMAWAANTLSIPVVAVDDYWGGALRIHPARPDIICTVDEYSANIPNIDFPEAKVVITGNPGARNLTASREVMGKVESLRRKYDNVIVFVGGGLDSTTDDIKFLTQCAELTGGNWCLIPAFHPKARDRKLPDGKKTYREFWSGMLAVLGDRVKYVDGRGDELVACASMVVSHRSTLMTAAAYMGKIVVSIQTSAGRKDMVGETERGKVPHVELGVAPLVKEPTDLSTFGPPNPDTVREKIFPFDPNIAYNAIVEHLSQRPS